MVRVVIEGWTAGLNKVQLNVLLRTRAGYGLAQAKDAVDRLLGGHVVSFEISDLALADAFCVSARAVGAVCSVHPHALSGTH